MRRIWLWSGAAPTARAQQPLQSLRAPGRAAPGAVPEARRVTVILARKSLLSPAWLRQDHSDRPGLGNEHTAPAPAADRAALPSSALPSASQAVTRGLPARGSQEAQSVPPGPACIPQTAGPGCGSAQTHFWTCHSLFQSSDTARPWHSTQAGFEVSPHSSVFSHSSSSSPSPVPGLALSTFWEGVAATGACRDGGCQGCKVCRLHPAAPFGPLARLETAEKLPHRCRAQKY